MMQVKAEFFGHSIIVTKALGGTGKLYIDGKVVDTSALVSRHRAIMVGAITEDGKTHIVEISFGGSILRLKFVVCVDGKEIARGR